MKKQLILCLMGIMMFQFYASAQDVQFDGNINFFDQIWRRGDVGIGFGSGDGINEPLSVMGNIFVSEDIRGYNTASNTALGLFGNTTSDNGAYMRLYGNTGSNAGNVAFNSHEEGTIKFFNKKDNWTELMRIQDNGMVVIGDANIDEPATNFLLAVDGGIQTEKIKVCHSSNGWCDYVFEKDYFLKSVFEVEAFIKKHKHLPNVPSAKEVEEDGIDVAEMDATLLRQIEELWLHVIDLKKENETLKAKVNELEK